MGFPFSVPHVAPLDYPIGRWDRRCRVFSEKPLSRWVNVKHRNGDTALHVAARRADTEVVETVSGFALNRRSPGRG